MDLRLKKAYIGREQPSETHGRYGLCSSATIVRKAMSDPLQADEILCANSYYRFDEKRIMALK